MEHSHILYDTDPHFKVNAISRAVTNGSYKKVKLMQYDHNSERYTFEAPRFIEGHDLLECNVVEVHYLNIEANTKNTKAGVYTVNDLHENDDDPNSVVWSWLVSSNATQYVGQLSFLIRFSCVREDGRIEYAWNTDVYSGISIASGIYNSDAITVDYADVLNEWWNELKSNQVVSLEQTTFGDGDGGENVWTATFGDGRTSDLVVKNGSRGEKGFIGSIETIDKKRLNFFYGTRAEYEALTAEQKKGLFAIITDDTAKADLHAAIDALQSRTDALQSRTDALETKTADILPRKAVADAVLPGAGWYAGHIYDSREDLMAYIPLFYWGGGVSARYPAVFPYFITVVRDGTCAAKKVTGVDQYGVDDRELTTAQIFLSKIEYSETEV